LCGDFVAFRRITDPTYVPTESEANFLSKEDKEAIQVWSSNPGTLDPTELSKAPLMVDFFLKHYSPVSRLPSEPVLNRLQSCLKGLSDTTPEYGGCLLKLIVMKEARSGERKEDFLSSARDYLSWFARNRAMLRSLPEMAQARDRLAELVGTAGSPERREPADNPRP
jgi:hypothetical protein